jgi:hypothetical protein
MVGEPVAIQKLSMLDVLKADMTDIGLYTLMGPALLTAM